MKKYQHEDKYSKIELVDGIVFGDFRYADLDLGIAIQIVNNRKEVCSGIPRPMLVDLTSVKNVTKEARDYFGTDEGFSLLKASAIIIESPLSSFLANFFMKINFVKTAIPLKVFHLKEREKAVIWLKEFL
jgi:hypothetical protein